jgi:hypothetical protein
LGEGWLEGVEKGGKVRVIKKVFRGFVKKKGFRVRGFL